MIGNRHRTSLIGVRRRRGFRKRSSVLGNRAKLLPAGKQQSLTSRKRPRPYLGIPPHLEGLFFREAALMMQALLEDEAAEVGADSA